ncbi:carbohydrate ABC transporter permease [Salinispira pacifica]
MEVVERSTRNRKILEATAFIAPAGLLLLLSVGYPVVYLVSHSLFSENFADPSTPARFVALGNYADLLGRERFWHTLAVTALFVCSAVTVEFLFGLDIALLLQRTGSMLRRILVSLFLIPSMMMPIAVGLMWRYMFNYDYGMVSYYLKAIHILGPSGLIGNPLLIRPATALAALVVTDIWEWTPFISLILLAGLESLPITPFDAAKVDGASAWTQFFRITLPLLRRAVTISLLIRIVDAMRVFDIVYVMTNGGPGRATETVQLYTYHLGFQTFEIGLSFALVLMVIAVTIGASVVIFRMAARPERY